MQENNYHNFPELLKKLMDVRQFEQTGRVDRSVFEKNKCAGKANGGFDGGETPEGLNFHEWLYNGDFSHFHTYINSRKDQYAFLFEEEKDNKQLILEKVEEIEKDISVTEITMQIDIGFITEKLNQLKQLLK